MSVPKLRFKEFKGKWESKELGQVASITSGGTPKRTKPEYWSGDIPWVTTSLVDFNLITKADEYITKEGLANSSAKLFPKDTLLMAMYGQGKTRGKVAILGIESTTNQACAAILINKDLLDIQFVFQNLSDRYDEIRDLSNTGGQENLSAGLIKEIAINLPSFKEQTKIADFLMAVDEKIAQLTQKCELLARYKKGVMQQLFSQDLRFKDDCDRAFPEWEYILIGEIINFENGKAHESSITDNGNYIVVNSKFISSNGTVIKRSNIAISPLRSNTIVMVMSDVPNGKALAKCYFIESDDKYTLNQRICSITSQIAAPKFLFYQINRNSYYLKFDNGVGQTNLRKDDVLSCPIMYPPSIKEQIKIADFLTSIDEKITQAQTYLETVKQYKQGLLQQMFV